MPVYTTPLGEFDTSTADSALGRELHIDHDRPPLGSFVFGPTFDGTCFAIKDNLLYFCKPKQPEHWPPLFNVEVSTPDKPCQTGVIYNGQVYVLTKSDIFYIQGTGGGTFLPLKRKAKTGAHNIRGAVSVDGKGIYHTGPDGIYLFSSGSTDIKLTEQTLDPVFRGTETNGIPGVYDMTNSWLHGYGNRLYFGYRSIAEGYANNVITLNLDTGRVANYNYNDGAEISIRAIANDLTNSRILIGDNTGFVREIEKKSATDDSGEAISWEVQSKDYTLQTRAHFPRFVKYDVDASSASSVTGSLLLNGSVHQTHTITGSRITKRRLVETGNGERAAIRVAGSGPATVYAVEFE